MMKRLVFTFVALIVTLVINAVPAKRTTFIATQSDGTKLTLMLVGDEYHHYFLNMETQEKMLRKADGDYYVVSNEALQELSKKGAARRVQANAARRARLKAPAKIGSTSGAMTGSKKGLVILVNFQDKKLANTHTQTVFNNQFNQVGYSENNHIGSVHDYFYDQSYKQFDLIFDVVGPVTVSKNMNYYGANDSEGSDTHPAEMIIEACKLADAQGVNFKDYDWDGDGYVDQVYVIYAGYGEAYGASDDTIWPHEWTLSSAKYYGDGTGRLYLDGKYIDTYACSCELSGTTGTTLNGIGTACHEFSHCLGFPDFYDTSYAGGFGMNSWDLMDGGSYNGPDGYGEVPAGYTAYERYEAGWLEPEILDKAATITDMKPIGDEPEAYFIFNEAETNEWFVLENRQNKGWFKYVDTYTTPHGLLISHVDFDQTAWNNNEPNAVATHQRMSIVPANKTYGTKKTSNGDTYYTCSETQLKGHLFPGSSRVTSFIPNDWSTAGGKWFNKDTDGTYFSSHYLTDITESNGNISFKVDGGAVVDDGSRFTITYNAGTGTCSPSSWTQSSFQETTTLPEAYGPNSDWTFVGWSTASVEETTKFPSTLIYYANSTILPTENMTLYAVYKQTVSGGTGGGGNYELVESELTDWSGEYIIAYSNDIMANGSKGGTTGIGAQNNNVAPGSNLSDKSISTEWGDQYHVTLEAIDGGYVLKTQDGKYNYRTTNKNGIADTENIETASKYPITVDFVSSERIDLCVKGTAFHYNTNGYFRFYKNLGQSPVYLYKKQGTLKNVTYSSNPSGGALIEPTISFASTATKNLLVGDKYTNKATATNSTGTISYSSSNTNVATVNSETGEITATGVGTATITAFVDAVVGVSKSASTTFQVNVTMPELTGIAIATPATTTSFNEGDSFTAEGLSITASYKNDYSQTLTEGFATSPAEGDAVAFGTTTVEVSLTEGSVTKTATYSITVSELPKYEVTFVINGKSTTIKESIAKNGVVAPNVADINGYTFSGWSLTDVTEETTTKPQTVTLTDGKYMPTEATTLYAVYVRSEANVVDGFKLSLLYKDKTYYAGAYNSSSTRLDSKTTEADAVTLYFDEGYLWYVSGGKLYYLYNIDGKPDLKSTQDKKTASATWTKTEEEDGSVTFYSSTTERYLALNYSSKDIIRCYGSTYPHNWNLTKTGETYSVGETHYYTGHPGAEEEVKSIGGLARMIKTAIEEGTITVKEIEEYRDIILEK